MKFHRASLAHAQEIVAQLLEAVIDATDRRLTLAKLEGDAAFFVRRVSAGAEPERRVRRRAVGGHLSRVPRARLGPQGQHAVHLRRVQQAGNLKIKLVGHLGEAAVQRVKNLTELAGVDVILVHRC